MRYALIVDKDGTAGEDGAVACSPLGGLLVWATADEAADAGRSLAKKGAAKLVYVVALKPIMVFMARGPKEDAEWAKPAITEADEKSEPKPGSN